MSSHRRRPCHGHRLAWLASAASSVLLFAAGCQRDVYEVKLEPSDKGLVRTISVWREGEPQPTKPEDVKPHQRHNAEQLSRLGELYPERLTNDADIHQTFRGTFAEKMPADVGGSGTYEAIDSPLGSSHSYVERFRGSGDFDAQIYDHRAAADRLTEITMGWFDEQLKTSPHKAAVRRWLHQDFRQDLRNVVAFLLVAPRSLDDTGEGPIHLTDPGKPTDNPMLRIMQYLVERGYFGAAEAVRLRSSESQGPWLLTFARRKLGNVCKLSPAEADKEFAFLAPTEECAESWRVYLRTTPEYARLLNEWKKSKKPKVEEPDPGKVIEEIVMPMVVSAFNTRSDSVRIQLKVPVPPYLHNGELVEDTIHWRRLLNPAGYGTPLVCTAMWSVPNREFQLKHFGKVALHGEKLAVFASLYRSLSAARQAEFTKHLTSLEPGDALKIRAGDFRPQAAVGPEEGTTIERLTELLAQNL